MDPLRHRYSRAGDGLRHRVENGRTENGRRRLHYGSVHSRLTWVDRDVETTSAQSGNGVGRLRVSKRAVLLRRNSHDRGRTVRARNVRDVFARNAFGKSQELRENSADNLTHTNPRLRNNASVTLSISKSASSFV